MSEHHRVAVIGAGFSGIGLGIRMLQEGIDDFIVLEKAAEVGGTWEANTYPGIQCDIPSHLYSLSFMPNPGWTRTFSEGAEIWDYLRRCARDGGLTPHLRLGCEVLDAEWDEEGKRWRIETSGGSLSATVLIAANGPLSEPAIPDIPGLDGFSGALWHSARWDHEMELRGKRVAVVGTGASAIQIVPRIQPEVEKLYVFQRTPPWVMPHRDRAIPRGERLLYERIPLAQRLSRGWSYLLRESIVPGLIRNPGPAEPDGADRPGPPAPPGPGSRPTRPARALIPDRLQENPAVERLVPGAPAAQRRAGQLRRLRDATARARSAPTGRRRRSMR